MALKQKLAHVANKTVVEQRTNTHTRAHKAHAHTQRTRAPIGTSKTIKHQNLALIYTHMGVYEYRILVTSISRSRRRCTLGVKGTGDMILPLSVVYICVYVDRRRYTTDAHVVLSEILKIRK